MKTVIKAVTLLLFITILFNSCANNKNRTGLSSTLQSTEPISSSVNSTSEPSTTEDSSTTNNTSTSEETTTPPDTSIPPISSEIGSDDPTSDPKYVIEYDPNSITNTVISTNIESVTASNAFVYNVTDGILMGAKGNGINIVPASVTKLLTALYALKSLPHDLVISPKTDELSLIDKESSIAYIKSHHKLTVEQLIKGMLLPSGNDAAYALAGGAARYLSGDENLKGQAAIDWFMSNVNRFALELGCTGTHFIVPDGCADQDHYTSSHDLVIIGMACLNDPIISAYTKIVSEKVYYASGHSITWNNSNSLINPESKYYSPYVTGLKTGSLSNNYCIYSSAEIDGKIFLIGVFGAPTKSGRYDDAHIMINSILNYYNIT